MSQPIILPLLGTPLYRQVIRYLQTDATLTAALGAGLNSIYPNYTSDGPSADRVQCPTPFIIVAPFGSRATDRFAREIKVILEIHDDEDQGAVRWPGIVQRVKQTLVIKEWKPATDTMANYKTGLHFESESPPDLPEPVYGSNAIQLVFACLATDTTSGHGYNG